MSLPRRPSGSEWDGPYRDALEAGRLVVQRCRSCGRARGIPSLRCPTCAAAEHDWVDAPATGTVFTWTTTHRPFHPEFQDVPFTVAVVELDGEEDDDIHLVAAIDGAEPDDPRLAVGARVEVRVREDAAGIRLPGASLAGAGGGEQR